MAAPNRGIPGSAFERAGQGSGALGLPNQNTRSGSGSSVSWMMPQSGGIPGSAFERAGQGSGGLGTAYNQKYGSGGQPLPWESGDDFWGRTGDERYRPGDFDMRDPGALESAFTNRGSDFLQPQQSSQYWESVQGRAAPQTGNNSQQWFNQFQGTPASLDPYYERARERTADDINSAFAARGMYGSSAATGALGDAMVGLNAEQANREADYGLAYQGMGGGLAAEADANAARAAGLSLQDMLGRGGLAMGADSATLNALNSYFESAAGAQGARRGRVQDFFSNVSMPAVASAGMAGDAFGGGFASDEELFMQALMLQMGIPAERANQIYRDNEQFKSNVTWGLNTASSADALTNS